MSDLWVKEMKTLASTLLGSPQTIPTKFTGLTKVERALLKRQLKGNKDKLKVAEIKKQLKQDDILKRKWNVTAPFYNPLQSLSYKLSDQNVVQYLDLKSQGLDRWLIPNLKGKSHETGFGKYFNWARFRGTPDNPVLFGRELPQDPVARQAVLFQYLNKVGVLEARLALTSLLAHPKSYLTNILGNSQNTITNTGFTNFKKAKDTQWLINNVFNGAKLKDGTVIRTRDDIQRFVSEVGALESFYINEAQMDKRLDSRKMIPALKEIFGVGVDKADIKATFKKYQVWDSVVNLGGQFMQKSERTLRTDAFIAHYLNARTTLGRIIPDLPYNHPYLIGMALKGVEATQFLYHNIRRPTISRSVMGKIFTRFQPFVWNSIRFRRNLYQDAKLYGFKDKASMDRLKRLSVLDMTTMALASVYAGSIFDSVLPPPYNYIQDTASLLFGDETERERAFFNAYPTPYLAPLQAVTAPVNRYWIPLMTATINGEWDRFLSYYIHTLYPFGRLARSTAMTLERPEMFGEFMLGIPIHRIGADIRKSLKEEAEE